MRPMFSLLPIVLVLGSCGSPPKPPTVDESLKRPVNSAMAVDLQVCKSDLTNTRIVATESSRRAEAAAVTLERASWRQQAFAAAPVAPPAATPANSVFTIRFDFGSARLVVPADIAPALIESARSAPLVLLRGRTDGAIDSARESRIARERAVAVRDYLVAAGVNQAHIRATYQPVGDHAADNTSPVGQVMNRRVEVEVYRVLPTAIGSSSAAAATP